MARRDRSAFAAMLARACAAISAAFRRGLAFRTKVIHFRLRQMLNTDEFV
jgi:hypothetical protein